MWIQVEFPNELSEIEIFWIYYSDLRLLFGIFDIDTKDVNFVLTNKWSSKKENDLWNFCNFWYFRIFSFLILIIAF